MDVVQEIFLISECPLILGVGRFWICSSQLYLNLNISEMSFRLSTMQKSAQRSASRGKTLDAVINSWCNITVTHGPHQARLPTTSKQ